MGVLRGLPAGSSCARVLFLSQGMGREDEQRGRPLADRALVEQKFKEVSAMYDRDSKGRRM